MLNNNQSDLITSRSELIELFRNPLAHPSVNIIEARELSSENRKLIQRRACSNCSAARYRFLTPSAWRKNLSRYYFTGVFLATQSLAYQCSSRQPSSFQLLPTEVVFEIVTLIDSSRHRFSCFSGKHHRKMLRLAFSMSFNSMSHDSWQRASHISTAEVYGSFHCKFVSDAVIKLFDDYRRFDCIVYRMLRCLGSYERRRFL